MRNWGVLFFRQVRQSAPESAIREFPFMSFYREQEMSICLLIGYRWAQYKNYALTPMEWRSKEVHLKASVVFMVGQKSSLRMPPRVGVAFRLHRNSVIHIMLISFCRLMLLRTGKSRKSMLNSWQICHIGENGLVRTDSVVGGCLGGAGSPCLAFAALLNTSGSEAGLCTAMAI